jgi:hypothetical protein
MVDHLPHHPKVEDSSFATTGKNRPEFKSHQKSLITIGPRRGKGEPYLLSLVGMITIRIFLCHRVAVSCQSPVFLTSACLIH